MLVKLNVGMIDKFYHGKDVIDRIKKNSSKSPCGSEQHTPYSLIILDKNMPILDGIETSSIIREWQREDQYGVRDCKLVLLTGDETINVREYDKELFDETINKPLV